MALDGERLGQAIAAAVTANAPSDSAPVTPAQLAAMWEAIGTEIVNEITANGVVTTPGAGTGTIS